MSENGIDANGDTDTKQDQEQDDTAAWPDAGQVDGEDKFFEENPFDAAAGTAAGADINGIEETEIKQQSNNSISEGVHEPQREHERELAEADRQRKDQVDEEEKRRREATEREQAR